MFCPPPRLQDLRFLLQHQPACLRLCITFSRPCERTDARDQPCTPTRVCILHHCLCTTQHHPASSLILGSWFMVLVGLQVLNSLSSLAPFTLDLFTSPTSLNCNCLSLCLPNLIKSTFLRLRFFVSTLLYPAWTNTTTFTSTAVYSYSYSYNCNCNCSPLRTVSLPCSMPLDWD